MLGPALLMASRSPLVRKAVLATPLTRKLVDRFVAGEGLADALAATDELTGGGAAVTIDHLGEETTSATQAAEIRDAYVLLLDRLGGLGLGERAEVSVKLSAVGQALPGDGDRIALDNARAICEAADRTGTTVTLDMEDHTTVDSTLGVLRELRVDFPWVGAVLQSCLKRTEQDCRELSTSGSRVRLVKGAYAEPSSVAHTDKSEVDLAYVRCLRTLMRGMGYPMVATHDTRMLDIAANLADEAGRKADTFEYQMLYGIRTGEQRRLIDEGAQVRVYVPYGADWYGYFMRRLAERPANVAFFIRSVVSR